MLPNYAHSTRPRWMLVFCLLLLWLVPATEAQQSQYDRGTPPQHAAGVSQFGSYAWADLGTVNLSNGALNIQFPLGSVGGRGLSLPLTLNYSSKVWSGRIDTEYTLPDPPPDVPVEPDPPVAYAVFAEGDDNVNLTQHIAPGWTIGFAPLLKVRGIPIQVIPNQPNTPNICGSTYGLVRLTLILPDKGEIELRDDLTNGAPLAAQLDSVGCYNMDGYRGRRWHATDGSGTIFISDVDNGVSRGDLNGVLITADGTRYRFSGGSYFQDLKRMLGDGVATSITDRHGNQILINGATYTDPLGRISRIQQNVPDPDNPSVTLPFLVTFPGYGGASRYIKIKTGVMNQNYRSGINPVLPVINGDWDPHSMGYDWPGTSLFQKSYGLYAYQIDNLMVVTEVVLPNGRSLHFKYNEFGEVAEVQYPTGGKAQYDYGKRTSLPSGNSPLWETTTASHDISSDVTGVDRALVTRRVYADGINLESTWSYGYGPQLHNGSYQPCTQVTATAAAGGVSLNQRHFFLPAGRYTNSNSGTHDGTYYTLWSTGVEWLTETLDMAGASVLAATEQDWAQRTPVSWTTGYPQEQPANDNRISEERKILDTGAVAKVGYLYDQYNNLTEIKDYDYNQSLKRRTVTAYLNANNGYNYQTNDAIHLLRLPEQATVYDGAGNQVAKTIISYDEATYLLAPYGGQVSGWAAPSTGVRGNPTTTSRWLDTTNTWLATHAAYDQVGNVRKTWDARADKPEAERVTQIEYTDTFSGGSSALPTYAYPTHTISPVPDPTNVRATNAPLESWTTYDYSTGLVTQSKDANNKIITYDYTDPLDRLKQVNRPDGGRTTYTYVDVHQCGPYVETRTLLDAAGRELDAFQFFDGLGRGVRTFQYEGQDPANPYLTADTQYDALGRVRRVSNPYRSAGCTAPVNPAGNWTETSYDALSRAVNIKTTADNAQVVSTYSGNTVMVTDQAGKVRSSVTDALGRLMSVTEAPGVAGYGFVTTYAYDALGNLRKVDQGGQFRYFMYDSLSRLIRARNPEQAVNAALNTTADPISGNTQWALAYAYDQNGNLTSRTDARNITTTYLYDNLNRVKQTSYTDGTPLTLLTYDFATNGRGRFYADYESSTTGTINYVTAYDAVGRPSARQTTFYVLGSGWSSGYSATRQYDKAGNVTGQTYPSGHTVNYSYDAAGRLGNNGASLAFTGNLGDGVLRTYAAGIQYTARSQMELEQYGTTTPLYHKLRYNVRGQVYDIRLSTGNDIGGTYDRGCLQFFYSSNMSLGASGTDNNGNLVAQQHWIPGAGMRQDNYQYDALNRLMQVQEYENGSAFLFQQVYTYDRWGNRTINTSQTTPNAGINNLLFVVDPAGNNHLLPGGGGMITYDAAGNQTYDNYSTGTVAVSRLFDAENRLTETRNAGNETQSVYTYDAGGRRVRRNVNGVVTWQVSGFEGELLAEYAAGAAASMPQKEYGYRGGALLVTAEPNATVRWLVPDHLGTPRMVADQTGSLQNVRRHDYLPFGEDLTWQGGRTAAQGYAADSVRQQFTGKERDNETALDYFNARYYSSAQGRFTSVDPGNYQAMLDPSDPQSWNAYAYVNNNPLSRNDPDGRGFWEKFKNWWVGYGWRSNEEVQQLEDKWRGWLRDRQKEAGGNLVYCQNTGQCQRVNIDALSRDDVFHYSALLKRSIENGTLQYYSKDEIDMMSQATQIAGAAAQIPQHVRDTLNQIKRAGAPPSGYKGGKQFMNDGREGGQVLPKTDAQGKPINYKEYDVQPYQQGVNRGAERLVRGSDGSAWYTSDHYKTFTRIE